MKRISFLSLTMLFLVSAIRWGQGDGVKIAVASNNKTAVSDVALWQAAVPTI